MFGLDSSCHHLIMNFEDVRQIAITLPNVEEGTSYGTPAFKVKGKLFVRLKEDGETLVVKVDPDERDMLLKASPDSLFLTDHYVNYPWVLVRLPVVSREELEERIVEAWRLAVPSKLVDDHRSHTARSE